MLPANNHSWPAQLDALIAAPRHHMLLFENEQVRVLMAIVPPGETVPVHTHRWPSVAYLQNWSDFLRRDEDGNILRGSRQFPQPTVGGAAWADPFPPHSLENVGEAELRVLMIEMKAEG
jgi:hypothetical protein